MNMMLKDTEDEDGIGWNMLGLADMEDGMMELNGIDWNGLEWAGICWDVHSWDRDQQKKYSIFCCQ